MNEIKKPTARYIAKIRALADEVRQISYDEIAKLDPMRAKMWRVRMEFCGFVDAMENGKKVFYELKEAV